MSSLIAGKAGAETGLAIGSANRVLRIAKSGTARSVMNLLGRVQSYWAARSQNAYADDLSFRQAAARFPNRNEFHQYMHHHFAHLCPPALKTHRAYYSIKQRGFGEDAFHAMWWLLLREYKTRSCLEIGVYRGQVLSLWTLISGILGLGCEVHGISPFSAAGDSVSAYPEDVDYYADTIASFQTLKLPLPQLTVARSSDQRALDLIESRRWDLIYIDGSHDYEVVLADYRASRRNLNVGGLLVLDDASLGSSFAPPRFSFAGHPGPSRVAREYAMKELSFIGAVGHANVFERPPASPPAPTI